MRLREALFPDDLPVLRLLMAEYLLDFDPHGDPAQTWDDLYYVACQQEAATGMLAVLFAEDDAGLFGFAMLRVELLWYRPGLRLGTFEELYVRAEHRRRGAGRALVALGEQWFRRRGIEIWTASVLEENPSALLFWQSIGFEMRVRRLFKS